MFVRHPQFETASLRDNARGRNSFVRIHFAQAALVAILPAIVALAGCADPQAPVFPVKGSVTYQGKPAAGAQVFLNAVKANEIDDVSANATVGTDGSYAITTYEPGDGAPAGDYVVTVQWFKLVTNDGGSGAGPNVLPKEYASPTTSPVKVSVSGPTDVPTIAIK
jgi:hypothetical protein